ncbi:MAG: class I SAM-dependent methyltransferase [Pseudomonadota bacterium]
MMKIELDGVPETMLWPLWNRAYETRRHDALIEDPLAVKLVDKIDYDFPASFGKPSRAHGVRARVGDDLLRDFLSRFGERACVVALGEGLETQYWRLGEPDVHWLSVDLEESIDVRSRLLPAGKTQRHCSLSALDEAWMDLVPEGKVPFISAMGLLMYFREQEVVELLTAIARRFPEAELFFDAIPPAFSKKTLRGHKITKTYQAPAMPWGISVEHLPSFIEEIPGLNAVEVQDYAAPFPFAMGIYSLLAKIKPIRRALAPSLVHASVSAKAHNP